MKAKIALSSRVKRLMIFNAKGGVGKTALALNLALTFDFGVITNDLASIVPRVLPAAHVRILDEFVEEKYLPILHKSDAVIFDFGGFPDDRAKEAIDFSSTVLVPVLPYKENYIVSLNFIAELLRHKSQDKIIVIVNQTKGDQFQKAREVIWNFYPDIAVFNVKQSSAFAWMVEKKKSILQLSEEYPSFTRHWSPVAEQFNALAKYLCEQIGDKKWTS